MANAYFYSNIATPTTLSGNINNNVTTCTVSSTTGWPGTTPYVVALDYGTSNEELVKVTNNASGTLTIVRGFGGTSGVSHSTGAVVRHVYNAQDATDFRTHEAATSAVHGIAGSFVGTTDSQTLTNKTLTSPTINSGVLASGGSMAGTFTGTPTFSGAVVLSGAPQITAGGSLAGTFSGSPTFSGTPTFSGSTTAMTVTGELAMQNLVRGTRANATDSQYEARKTGDANARWFARADGLMSWGPGTAAIDTTLYRNAPGELMAGQDFTVTGNLKANNFYTGVWDSWTPTWTTSTGLHLPSFGNATVSCYFAKAGRITFFTIRIVFGSTTNFGSGATAGDNWYFSLPQTAARVNDTIGQYNARPGSGTASMGSISVVSTDATVMQLNVNSGQPNAVALTNTGVADSLTPVTWTSGDQLTAFGMYEAAN